MADQKNRVINLWNSLPDHIVTAPSINCFKNKLDNFLLGNGYN